MKAPSAIAAAQTTRLVFVNVTMRSSLLIDKDFVRIRRRPPHPVLEGKHTNDDLLLRLFDREPVADEIMELCPAANELLVEARGVGRVGGEPRVAGDDELRELGPGGVALGAQPGHALLRDGARLDELLKEESLEKKRR